MTTINALNHEPFSLAQFAEAGRIEACRQLDQQRRASLGQFLTPPHIARFMASFVSRVPDEIDLLDPGAGMGALTAAFVAEVLRRPTRPSVIRADAFEIETGFHDQLADVLNACRDECRRAGLAFELRILPKDFLEAATDSLSGSDLFRTRALPSYTHVIMNPPYRKLNAQSRDRLRLREVGIETSNYYAAFLWLAMRLLRTGGEFISINPRSFCNGPYFKPFRSDFLREMTLKRLHIFDSRTAAFRDDDVLQENLILHAIKGEAEPEQVTISNCNGDADAPIVERQVAYRDVIAPSDPEMFIHLVVNEEHSEAKSRMERFSHSLRSLGLNVSTGRVVDFRAKDHLRQDPADDTVPLVYPCHFNGGFVQWPKPGSRKPNAIVRNASTQELLVPAGVYVLVKRFTSKEERRRIVACIYDPDRIKAEWVGFENHLNYFHLRGGGMSMTLAKGLAAFLNSTVVDTYFREFSGHTQVNATDMRTLKYPTKEELERLGCDITDSGLSQQDLDSLIDRTLFG